MIENSKLKIGGNTFKVWIGKKIEKFGSLGSKIIENNTPTYVTNPIAKLVNPFTLLISFTVDNTKKYQIVLQGDYKQKYKECEDGAINLSENEIFMIINQHQQNWYKKE